MESKLAIIQYDYKIFLARRSGAGLSTCPRSWLSLQSYLLLLKIDNCTIFQIVKWRLASSGSQLLSQTTVWVPKNLYNSHKQSDVVKRICECFSRAPTRGALPAFHIYLEQGWRKAVFRCFQNHWGLVLQWRSIQYGIYKKCRVPGPRASYPVCPYGKPFTPQITLTAHRR